MSTQRHLRLICFVWRVRPVRGGIRRDRSKHARAAVAVPQLLLSKASCRMAQYLTDILCGRATDAAMVTLAAAYLAVTLLVQEARFVKRFYVRRLTNNGAINFNGYTITLADGTVLR